MFGSEKFFGSGGGAAAFYTQEIGNSLKFEDGDSPYLSRTPASAGNQKTWTFSAWFKRGNINADSMIFSASSNSSNLFYLQVRQDSLDNVIVVTWRQGSATTRGLTTDAEFRDPSSYYHVVLACDTTQSSASDRLKLYINGSEVTSFSLDNRSTISQNSDLIVNSANLHTIGAYSLALNAHYDGYLAEVNFIDGTALDPTSFGETKEGIWIPKDPTGLTYGTNGFRLPFTETTTANGFNTVTYSGTGATQSIDGVGFQPDFIWIKERSSTSSHILSDTVRGATKYLESDTTDVEATASNIVTSFDVDGFTTGNSGATNQSGQTYVGWCWGGGTNDKTYTVTVVDDSGNKYRFDGHGTSSIALNLTEGATYTFNYPSAHPLRFSTTSDGTHGGGSEYTTGVTYVSSTQVKITVPSGAPVLYYYCSIHSGMGGQINTNTTDGPTHAEGTILSRTKPNADYGFSIVQYTGSGANATVAHGLSSAPKLILFKKRDVATDWMVYNHTIGNNRFLYLNLANAQTGTDSSYFNDTDPTDSLIHLGTYHRNNTSSERYIAYCFADVTGYQKIGTYTGNGSTTGPTVTTGFAPAFIMIKRTDSAADWQMYDNVRDTTNPVTATVAANKTDAESTFASGYDIDFNSTGFQIATGPSTAINTNGGTYIYLAIADTRDAAFWTDASGNSNNWTPNALQHSDVMPDTPTDGFSVMNPLYGDGGTTWKEGNLELSTANKGNNTSTFFMESGKWYWEAMGEGYVGAVCAFDKGQYNDSISISGSDSIGYYTNGYVYWGGGNDSTPATYTSSDIIGVALNMDDGQISFYKNNSLQVTLNFSSTITRLATEGCYACYNNGSTSTTKVVNFNFGQDSSFNAKEIAQGNADDNGKGDFYYAPPSGYLALCNANLPDPAIDPAAGKAPEDHFNTVLYTGNGSTNNITGVGFQPDFLWFKKRSTAGDHKLIDVIRGSGQALESNTTDVEANESSSMTSIDSDGFSLAGGAGAWNESPYSYVAWNWLAGGTGVSNTDGTITSTVSANTDAGFSICTYTGTGSATTFGHGLSSAPKWVVIKRRDGTASWQVFHTSLGGGKSIELDGTAAAGSTTSVWNNTAPTSSVVHIGTHGGTNTSSGTYVAYCFAEKEGYSKFSSYTGNGSTDGPFVYTGFRPAFIILKRTNSTASWLMSDNKRDPHNLVTTGLFPNGSGADTTGYDLDFLSNGFKIKDTTTIMNGSSSTYIYMAFAEQPFKYSNAR